MNFNVSASTLQSNLQSLGDIGLGNVNVVYDPNNGPGYRITFVGSMATATEANSLATTPTGAPLRMAFVYFPNGAIQPNWWPKGEGKDFELARTMEPLEKVKQQLQILGGMDHVNATPGPDGAGDHARASGTFLTGVRVKKTAGADIRVGVSVDQIAAEKLGNFTRLPSLELSGDKARPSGNCDSGYSCAYQFNLSWKTDSTPMPPEVDPRVVFERLFCNELPGESDANRAARLRDRKSILDFVADDARRLKQQLGYTDRRKMDEYLTAVRDVEMRIQHAERFPAVAPDFTKPEGIPKDREQHIHLMLDLLAQRIHVL